MRTRRSIRCAAAALALLAPCAASRAEIVHCTPITAVPATLTAPGLYCLTDDLDIDRPDPAITIASDDVTIDLNGHSLTKGGTYLSGGIQAVNRNRLTIRNGRLRGFSYGISLTALAPTYDSSGGHLVEDLVIENSALQGLIVTGRDNVVRHNRIAGTDSVERNTGALALGVAGPGARVIDNDVTRTRGIGATAILVLSASAVVEGNRVTGTLNASGNSSSVGIFVFSSPAAVVVGNRIANPSPDPTSLAIDFWGSSGVLARDNLITNFARGLHFESGSTGEYMGNLVTATTVPYTGGTPAGGTNY